MSVVNAWCGAVTHESFRVIAKTSGPSARLAVSTSSDLSSPAFFGPVAPSDGVVDLSASGLTPDTVYYWAVEDDGVLDTAKAGRARTFGTPGLPYSFTFAAGGCAGVNPLYPASSGLAPGQLSDSPVFDDILSRDPHFMVHTGDLHYYDLGSGLHGITGGGSLANYRTAYDDVLATRQGTLYRQVPLVYVWDDHDYGPDNSDGSHPSKDNAGQVYRERVPSYPLAAPNTAGDRGVYHSFQVGRVLFVVLDQRYYRQPNSDPAPRTMLGAGQLAWLQNLLTSPPAGVKLLVLISPQPTASTAVDSWGSYTEERDDIYGLFATYGWKSRMICIAGDAHEVKFSSGAIAGGSETAPRGFPLYVPNSLDSSSPNTPGPEGGYDLGGRVATGQRHYALVTVTDTGPAIQVTTRGMEWSP